MVNPPGLAVDARDPCARRQDRREQRAPVTHTASHVEDLADRLEPPALRDELEKIQVPPVVARIAEVLRRVLGPSFERIAHEGYGVSEISERPQRCRVRAK